ncbi:hypothetical protein AMS68_001719 [Peltaster fructicola]|uniref:Uncharacterized protein n=1 Tax=Peltaster fructicola TaxID=286661 RepID=A0A6H0XN70_9PEZI|nr:hypothetical protein AMS68_001719 [Peltaster fructicola]
MTDHDDRLLARLNALKPSSVTLSTAPSIEIETNKPDTPEDKLSERLKRLRAGESVLTKASPKTEEVQSRSVDHDDLHLHEWQADGNEQSVDDLLAELASNEQAQLKPDDPEDIQRLIREARDALPAEQQDYTSADSQDNNENGTKEEAVDEDKLDEQDADDYIQQVLAELEVERRYAPDDADHSNDEALPSALSDVQVIEPPSYEDSELEARFSKLAMGLPSAPSVAPTVKKQGKPKVKAVSKADDDMDSWCCICNDDGTLQCIDCDNDVYCRSCWTQGHGSGPGQEQGHKAVRYQPKKH